ncbi:SMP-30/gluconolactonase/LRE family protein [Pseudonocardia kujensis]|uniref:SMP-30/gluconolactonase/LRE family protein n=1 Tax=Pseudonocardia kujensis TaxID=1128675 RepID=UPI001E48CC99|nr:SMP-30/gluconolactonase/LRE family protein [Pseudonocardia kujensis]MCE0767855.1 SMP-30/gluconolactonase/LRE family protein [Pseudonocardia kujensis]
MPVPRVTACTFGGPDLATLYVTTSPRGWRRARSRWPAPCSPWCRACAGCGTGVRGLNGPSVAAEARRRGGAEARRRGGAEARRRGGAEARRRGGAEVSRPDR